MAALQYVYSVRHTPDSVTIETVNRGPHRSLGTQPCLINPCDSTVVFGGLYLNAMFHVLVNANSITSWLDCHIQYHSLLVKFEGFHEQKMVPAREPPNFHPPLGTATAGTAQFSLLGTLYEVGHFDRPIWLPASEVVYP